MGRPVVLAPSPGGSLNPDVSLTPERQGLGRGLDLCSVGRADQRVWARAQKDFCQVPQRSKE